MTLALFGCSHGAHRVLLRLGAAAGTMWFTALGAGTLYGYLLHGFLVKGSRLRGLVRPRLAAHAARARSWSPLFAAALVTVLCTPPVQRIFRFAMEPKMEWAFRPGAAGSGPSGSGSAAAGSGAAGAAAAQSGAGSATAVAGPGSAVAGSGPGAVVARSAATPRAVVPAQATRPPG